MRCAVNLGLLEEVVIILRGVVENGKRREGFTWMIPVSCPITLEELSILVICGKKAD